LKSEKIILYADGGARGNPGPAGAGAYLEDAAGVCLAKVHQYLGETTNNVAEYSALILGLKRALTFKPQYLVVKLDSQLVVRQLEGAYQVKQPHLKKLYSEVMGLLEKFPKIEIQHIPREENSEADLLANQAMDEGPSGP